MRACVREVGFTSVEREERLSARPAYFRRTVRAIILRSRVPIGSINGVWSTRGRTACHNRVDPRRARLREKEDVVVIRPAEQRARRMIRVSNFHLRLSRAR